jgi:hypothetical protein
VADQQADKLVVLTVTVAAAVTLVVVVVVVAIRPAGVVAAVQPDTQVAAVTKTKDSMHMVLHLAEVNILQHMEQAEAAELVY